MRRENVPENTHAQPPVFPVLHLYAHPIPTPWPVLLCILILTIFTAHIEYHVLMMLLLRAYLFVLLRIGKTKAFYFFRAGPVHVYLRTAFSPALPSDCFAIDFP
jgi:hypothetical protein